MRTYAYPLLALFLALTLSSCDAIADKLGISEVDINTTSAMGNIRVVPGEASVKSGNVNLGSTDIPDAFDVESIEIKAENVTYTPNSTSAPAGTLAAQGPGTISATILIGEGSQTVCLGTITASVDANNQVTSVSPSPVAIGVCSASLLTTLYNQLPDDTSFPSRSELEAYTVADVQALVNNSIQAGAFTLSVGLTVEGDIAGTVTIGEMTMNLDF